MTDIVLQGQNPVIEVQPGQKPVLMSRVIAEALGVVDRWTVVDPLGLEMGTGVAYVSEAEILAYPGVERMDWNDPDPAGYFTPTLYRGSGAAL